MNHRREFDAVAAWGLTVTAAYLITPYVGLLGITSLGLNYQILAIWALLMAPPIYFSYREGKGPLGWRSLNPVWALFMTLGLLGNFAAQLFLSGQSLIFSYYHKWFFLPAVLFIYTAHKLSGTSKKVYSAAAALNIAGGAYLFLEPAFQIWAFQTAAAIQGLPMLVDWYVRKA